MPASLEVSHSGQLHTPGKRDPSGYKGSNPFTSALADHVAESYIELTVVNG